VTSDLEPLTPVFEAVKLLKEQIADRALFGFAATPWTLACYLIDQKPFKHFERSTIWLNQRPRELHLLLEKLTELTVAYTLEQVKAGADIIQLFDSWGGILPKASYDEFSLNYSNKVFKALKLTNAKTILYINGASHLTENLGRSLADGFGIDSRATLSDFEKAFSNKTLQGNLDPSVLFGSSVREDTIRLLSGLYRKTQFILNLGHGVLQETPHGAVRDFVAAAKEFKL
jgi:uroporphyrinogen decarboxylase